jgi:hypothetical protein
MKTIFYFTLLACLTLVSSCGTLSETEGVPASKVIDGVQLELSSRITRTDRIKRTFGLSGTLTVRSLDGKPLPNLNYYYFSLRPKKAGFFIQYFQRDASGEWHDQSMTTTGKEPLLSVTEQYEANAFILNFNRPKMDGNNVNSYDVMEVLIGIVDSAGNRHLLANPAALVEVER